MWKEKRMKIETGTAKLDARKLTRLEVINHAGTSKELRFGRVFSAYKELGDFDTLSISIQDDGRTIKIFLDWYYERTIPKNSQCTTP